MGRRAIDWDKPDPWALPLGRQLTPSEWTELLSMRENGRCRLCLRKFDYAEIAAIIAHGDMRPALRLRYLNIRGFRNLDISKPDDRVSAFQRLHLPRIAASKA